MYSRAARILPHATLITRRGFHATRAQLSSPYHYPDGPLSNIPFNPRRRGFFLKFWTFCALGFGAPFLIAVYQSKKNS